MSEAVIVVFLQVLIIVVSILSVALGLLMGGEQDAELGIASESFRLYGLLPFQVLLLGYAILWVQTKRRHVYLPKRQAFYLLCMSPVWGSVVGVLIILIGVLL